MEEHGHLDAGRTLRIRLLGPVEAQCGDQFLALGGPKQRAVLAVLSLHANATVSPARLAEAVWEDASPAIGRTLQVHVSNLRQLVAACGGELLSVRSGYRLELPPGALDLDRFEELAGRGRHALTRGHPDSAARHLRAALDLVVGSPLEGLPETPQLRRAGDRINDAVLAVREDAVEAAILAGHHRRAIRELEDLASAHPYRERLTELLMWSLYLEGRQADALERFRALRERLANQLGVDPGPDLQRMHEAILQQADHLRVTSRPPVHAVPPRTSNLIDREEELSRLSAWLRSGNGGAVTVVGGGGCGKTRLAIEVAHVLGPAFPDGVRFVDLSTTTSPEEFGPALAAALEVGPRLTETALAAVRRWLSGQRMLLVLDTFEAVVDAAGELAELCSAAPDARVLVTSRLPLDLRRKRELRLGPLPTSGRQGGADGDAGASPAVRLLLERANGQRSLEVTPVVLEAAERICDRLDGVPLALELAAARTDRFQLTQVADRLDDLDFLRTADLDVPARHRTLQATLDWTLDLLPELSRELFWRLGVFRGSWDDAALEAIVGEGWPSDRLRDAMDALAAASLVDLAPAGRYVMPDTVHSYARSRMQDHPEAATVAARHGDHYIRVVDALAASAHTSDEVSAAATLQRDLANIREAMRRSRARGDHVLAADAALKLLRFVRRAGRAELEAEILQHLIDTFEVLPAELRFGAAWAAGSWFAERDREQAEQWLHRARELGRELPSTEPPYAVVLAQLAQVLIIGGKAGEALPVAEEGLASTTEDGMPRAFALFAMGWAHQWLGDLPRASALARRAVRAASGAGGWRAWPLLLLSRIAMLEGRAADATQLAEGVLEMSGQTEDRPLRCAATAHLGWAAQAAGDPAQSLRWWLEALEAADDLGRPFTIGNSLCAVAGALASAGQRKEALRLWGAAEAVQEAVGVVCAQGNVRLNHEVLQRTQDELGEHGRTLRAAGSAMPLDQAVALAQETGRRIV